MYFVLSIITAVHNSLAMNRLYWESISSHTTSPFELIIVDNHSTDGSERFFSELSARDSRVRYLRNAKNQSYPDSQIQGMAAACHDILCFLNNDVWFPRAWNEPFEKAIAASPHGIFSPSGEDAQPTLAGAEVLKRRWKRANALSHAWRALTFNDEHARLKKALTIMYGDLEKFTPPTPRSRPPAMPGIKGDCVIFGRRLLERIPQPWNPRVQAADWNLYLIAAREHERHPQFPLPQILFDTYVHHFGRYSARQKYEPLDPPREFVEIEALWGKRNGPPTLVGVSDDRIKKGGGAMALEIELIPLLKDNYAYFLREPVSGKCAVVDPSEADPVLEFLKKKNAKLDYVLNTHHHADHTGGNVKLSSTTGAKVVGPRADAARIPAIHTQVCAREPFWLGEAQAGILEIPGHTVGHIAFWFAESQAVFVGDTLFAMGCGRMFEGTPAEMYDSLRQLANLPKETRVYCGHEYTEANAAFAVTIDPENEKLKIRREKVKALRAEGRPTIPSTIGEELETNPFLRASDDAIRRQLGLTTSGPVKVFTEIRRRKDVFK